MDTTQVATEWNSIFQQTSSYFGIPVPILGIIITSALVLFAFLFCLLTFGSMLLGIAASIGIMIASNVLGFIPIWILVIYALISLYLSYFAYYAETGTTQETENGDRWEEYGNRLKMAYSSKFGGDNNGFNQEVDSRIKIMQNNGKGFTRSIAHRWLKRIERFTEVKK